MKVRTLILVSFIFAAVAAVAAVSSCASEDNGADSNADANAGDAKVAQNIRDRLVGVDWKSHLPPIAESSKGEVLKEKQSTSLAFAVINTYANENFGSLPPLMGWRIVFQGSGIQYTEPKELAAAIGNELTMGKTKKPIQLLVASDLRAPSHFMAVIAEACGDAMGKEIVLHTLIASKKGQKDRYLPFTYRFGAESEQVKKSTEDKLVVRMFWVNGQMVYEVKTWHAGKPSKSRKAMRAGMIHDLVNEASGEGTAIVASAKTKLADTIKQFAKNAPQVRLLELEVNLMRSRNIRIEESAPWGFVTLALDVVRTLNRERKTSGLAPFEVTIRSPGTTISEIEPPEIEFPPGDPTKDPTIDPRLEDEDPTDSPFHERRKR